MFAKIRNLLKTEIQLQS